MIDIIIEYRYMFVVFMAAAAVLGYCVGCFIDLPSKQKLEMIKKWLLWAIIEAEKELGSGTGKLKLSMVYDKFVKAFPALAKIITIEKFTALVDEVLQEAEHLINTNPKIFSLVERKEQG